MAKERHRDKVTAVAAAPTYVRERPAVRVALAQHRPAAQPRHWPPSDGGSVFLVALAAYLVGALVLALHYGSLPGDAVARVANAYYVLFSRDPHLAAIGFVWNPLPSLLDLPLLVFKDILPPLSERALAGCLVSAVAMAAAIHELWGTLGDWDVDRRARLALTACLGLNPLVFEYAANGMSEALFILALTFTLRRFARWLQHGGTQALATSALGLAGAYLIRNEVLGSVVLCTGVVATVTWAKSRGTPRARLQATLAEVSVFVVPFVVVFVGWATVSYVIVGDAFQQFRGNADVLQAAGGGVAGATSVRLVIQQLVGLSPLLIVAVGYAGAVALHRRDLRVLAPLSIFGGVLAFAFAAAAAGATFHWLRYWITALPLTVLLGGLMLSRTSDSTDTGGLQRYVPLVAGLAACLMLFGTVKTMGDPKLAPEERFSGLALLVSPPRHERPGDRVTNRIPGIARMARAIDGLHAGRGRILLDTGGACTPFLVLASHEPQQFVITNDRDFRQVLADPVAARVKYMLVPARGGQGNLDAINATYPDLESNPGGFAEIATRFRVSGCPTFGLYRVRAAERTSS